MSRECAAVRVIVSPQAHQDMGELCLYIMRQDGSERAESVLGRLESSILNLEDGFPERGNTLPELAGTGYDQFRELHLSPWRIIYELNGASVVVHWVFDGRRNVSEQLARRILSPQGT